MRPVARGTRTILLFLDRVASYTRAMFGGMAAYAVEHGPWRFVPVVAPAAFTSGVIRGKGIDGILARVSTRHMARAIVESGVPAVCVNPFRDIPLPFVCLDDEEVGRVAANYLHQAGLGSYAYCGIPYIWYSSPREQGFTEVLRGAGHTCATFGGAAQYAPRADRANHDERLDQWLKSLPRPVGLMGCDDARARQVLDACHRQNLRVPDDVAIVGAGNDPLICDIADPPLSSVAVAADRVGFEAARLLAQLMDGQSPPSLTKVIPPAGMVVRFSTKAATSDDPEVAQAIDVIRDQVHRGITVDDVLRVVPLSRRTLEMRFRAALGRSPAEEIRRVRMERAKRLLVETDAGMAGVAQGSGFSSANQLCETFRREAGVSPTRYRRQFRAG